MCVLTGRKEYEELREANGVLQERAREESKPNQSIVAAGMRGRHTTERALILGINLFNGKAMEEA